MYKNIFRGVLAVILLGLYVYAVIMAILVTNCLGQGAECTTYSKDSFTSGLVIAELANTESGEIPSGSVVNPTPSDKGAMDNLKIVTIVYLIVWVILGLLAFIIGFLLHPGILQPLTDLGQAWLGLAVAAVYAYLQIKPQPQQIKP